MKRLGVASRACWCICIRLNRASLLNPFLARVLLESVYQTYINMMNDHIRQQMDVANPFKFHHITNLKGVDQFDDTGPSVSAANVVLARTPFFCLSPY